MLAGCRRQRHASGWPARTAHSLNKEAASNKMPSFAASSNSATSTLCSVLSRPGCHSVLGVLRHDGLQRSCKAGCRQCTEHTQCRWCGCLQAACTLCLLTQRPAVTLAVVGLVQHNLRGQVVRGANLHIGRAEYRHLTSFNCSMLVFQPAGRCMIDGGEALCSAASLQWPAIQAVNAPGPSVLRSQLGCYPSTYRQPCSLLS